MCSDWNNNYTCIQPSYRIGRSTVWIDVLKRLFGRASPETTSPVKGGRKHGLCSGKVALDGSTTIQTIEKSVE
jgi:hypothetical protein